MSLQYVVIDNCPCPKPLYPILKKLKKETGCTYNSIYRGDDVATLLHRVGKHTQRELYEGWEKRLPGYYPANPPTMGTHILRGDGVVGKREAKLPWWKCGIDVNDSDVERLIAAAKKHGWILYRPYSSGSEYHHLNFAKKPSRWKAFYRNVFGKIGVSPAVPARKAPRPTSLSVNGAKFIASFEGFRADAYWDSYGGVWTIGYGTTHGVRRGDHVTQKQALALLQRDARAAVTSIRDLVHVRLNQNQLDALVSFVYNLGAGSLAESTLLKKLNKGDYKGAAAEFQKWCYAGGVRLAGLERRRRAEASLFLKK